MAVAFFFNYEHHRSEKILFSTRQSGPLNDSTNRLVDFKSFLEASVHPSIRKYLDEALFAQFQIINGNLNWGDYDLIFPVNDLYQGKI